VGWALCLGRRRAGSVAGSGGGGREAGLLGEKVDIVVYVRLVGPPCPSIQTHRQCSRGCRSTWIKTRACRHGTNPELPVLPPCRASMAAHGTLVAPVFLSSAPLPDYAPSLREKFRFQGVSGGVSRKVFWPSSGNGLGIGTKPELDRYAAEDRPPASSSGTRRLTRRVPELQGSAGSRKKMAWSRNISRRDGA